jgi:hypothetical protein
VSEKLTFTKRVAVVSIRETLDIRARAGRVYPDGLAEKIVDEIEADIGPVEIWPLDRVVDLMVARVLAHEGGDPKARGAAE